MPYVSELLGRAVVGERRLGKVRDVLAASGGLPLVTAVVLDRGDRFAWRDLVRDGRVLRLRPGASPATQSGGPEISLTKELLDRQILDARGRKVVRVNDVRLEQIGDALRIIGVDVGARGFLRRLGLERPAVAVADALGYAMPESVIPWTYVASLGEPSGLRLGIDREFVSKLHPAEAAELLDALPAPDRLRFLRLVDDLVLGQALTDASERVREEALEEIGDVRATQVLERMRPDEAADVLGGLDYETAERLLGQMGLRRSEVVRMLLGYHPRSAGGLMTPELVAIPKDTDTAAAIAILREKAPEAESIYYVYSVDDEGRLRGVVPLASLLTAPAEVTVGSIARTDVLRVNVNDTDEVVAEVMERYDLLALPVVDDDEVLKGIITIDDVMRTLQSRATDDLAAVTGGGEGAPGAALAAGHLGAVVAALAAGLGAALALSRSGESWRPWVVAGAMPLVLRLTHDQGSWSVAARLEEEEGAGALRGAALQIAASGIAALPVALGVVIAGMIAGGVRLAVAMGTALLFASAAAALLGAAIPAALALSGRREWVRRGRVVPLLSALGGLAVYLGVHAIMS